MDAALEMFSKIKDVLLYSNEIEIDGPNSSKVHKMALGMV